MLDVFYVESGSAKTGPALPEDISFLKHDQWSPASDGEWFVGRAVCLSAEFKQLGEDEALTDKADARPSFLAAKELPDPILPNSERRAPTTSDSRPKR
jgi:hypothetical protein